jgi:hypothetical protein
MRFSYFLLNEEKAYLGHRISDVLTVVHDLEEDLPGMGTRHILKVAEDIVTQIRKILHGQWSPRHTNDLKELQKIGVALMKAIDEKGDLKTLIPTISQSLETISGKLGIKTNDVQPPEEEGGAAGGENGQDMGMQLTANGPPPPGQPPAGGVPGQPPSPPMGLPPGPPMAGLPGMPPQ